MINEIRFFFIVVQFSFISFIHIIHIQYFVLLAQIISNLTGFYMIIWFFCSVGMVKLTKNRIFHIYFKYKQGFTSETPQETRAQR